MASSCLYVGTAVATLWLHNDHVRLRYHAGARAFEDFRGLLDHLRRALVQQGSGRALVDQRAMVPFTADEQAYLLDTWLPQAVATGSYRRAAVLSCRDVFSHLAAAAVINRVNGPALSCRYFGDEAAALAWLLKR